MSRVVGLDPGTVRIGVAVSDSARTMAFPRPSVPAGPQALATLKGLIEEVGADTVVVGRPVALQGNETASTLSADDFRHSLAGTVEGVEVVAVDERLTTATARRLMSDAGRSQRAQRDRIDSAAAVVLLQAFLDATPR